MMKQLCALALVLAALQAGSPSAVHASILSNVDLGGWDEAELGGGKWDDQNVNNPGPFPNVEAALSGAGLSTIGLTKILKIDDPDTSDTALGITFTINGQGGTSGSWTIDSPDLDLGGGLTLAYFSLKGGQKWSLWEIGPDTDANPLTYTNSWDTNLTGGGLLKDIKVKKDGSLKYTYYGLSHISFWGIAVPPPATASAPEPLSLVVWGALAGLGAIVQWKKRR
jgi:hypothetical protein